MGIFMCLAEVMKERHTMTKLNNFFEIQVLKHDLKHSYSQFDENVGCSHLPKDILELQNI